MTFSLLMFVIIFSHANEIRAKRVIQITPNATQYPIRNQNCTNDPFIASVPYEGKVFLHPWKTNERRGDWFYNRAYCAANCAEMVTIHSRPENTFFVNFMRTVGMDHPGIWLGAQIDNTKDIKEWDNKEKFDFELKLQGEYDEKSLTCLNLGWVYKSNWWRNYFCTGDIADKFYIACQRPASQTKINSTNISESTNSQPSLSPSSTPNFSSTTGSPMQSTTDSSFLSSPNDLLSSTKLTSNPTQTEKSTKSLSVGTTESLGSRPDSSTPKSTTNLSSNYSSSVNSMSSRSTTEPSLSSLATKLSKSIELTIQKSRNSFSYVTSGSSTNPSTSKSLVSSMPLRTFTESLFSGLVTELSTLTEPTEAATENDILRNSFSDITSSALPELLNERPEVPTDGNIARRSQTSDITRNADMKSSKKGDKSEKSAKPMKDRRRFDKSAYQKHNAAKILAQEP